MRQAIGTRTSGRIGIAFPLGLVLLLGLAGFLVWRHFRIEHSQDANILLAAHRYGVDPALVKALIWRESHFDVSARGRKGEIGLMQIMPQAAGREWAVARNVSAEPAALLSTPATNVDCGTWYLHKLLARYQNTDNPAAYALADYNAGRSNVLKWMDGPAATNSAAFIAQIRFSSTREYVRSILKRRGRYVSWAARAAHFEPQNRL